MHDKEEWRTYTEEQKAGFRARFATQRNWHIAVLAAVAFSIVPLSLALPERINYPLGDDWPPIGLVLSFPIIIMVALIGWRCPACGKPVLKGYRCSHCGLKFMIK